MTFRFDDETGDSGQPEGDWGEEDLEGYLDGTGDPPVLDGPNAGSLFPEDKGSYPVATRRLLTRLLKGPYIDGRAQEDLWATLLSEEELVKAWLGQVFLGLVIDLESKTAFTVQLDVSGFSVPVLLRRQRLSLIDSVLLLFLRERLIKSSLLGERAVVTDDEMHGWLDAFNLRNPHDSSGFRKKTETAISKIFKRFALLKKLPKASGRYEISPVVRLILQPEDVRALKENFQSMLDEHGLGELPESMEEETQAPPSEPQGPFVEPEEGFEHIGAAFQTETFGYDGTEDDALGEDDYGDEDSEDGDDDDLDDYLEDPDDDLDD
ncbi:MAG: DUF4194 domain-containing protein, partial [Deltaproteobacteria bacterium]|nr:DUF4194 domain-containing protein [Deltaproteobacteria bacterium]